MNIDEEQEIVKWREKNKKTTKSCAFVPIQKQVFKKWYVF